MIIVVGVGPGVGQVDEVVDGGGVALCRGLGTANGAYLRSIRVK